MKTYDLIIIGAGPAGLTAGIYARRYLLNILIIGKSYGGTITEAHKVCNFPSEEEINGFELGSKMIKQAEALGAEIKSEKVEDIKKDNDEFKVKTDKGLYKTKSIILAAGRKKQKLNIPGEKEFLGKGVSYCATCDAAFYKEKTVAVVGGSNSALTAALLLSEYAKKVYIIYRKDKFFRAEPAWKKQIEKNKKIKCIFNSNIKEIHGKESVKEVLLSSGETLTLDGVFVEIGAVPDETLTKKTDINTENGYIIVNKKQETNIKGIYAAGDLTNNPLKQVITACGEGAIAAKTAFDELKKGD